MSTSPQIAKYRALDDWFRTNQGKFVADAFVDELNRYRRLVKGDSLIQLGDCGSNPWLNNINAPVSWIVSPDTANKEIDLISSTNQMSLDRESIDIVIAPLSMEVDMTKAGLIDEIDRVLKPMGYVVVFGINPWGLWGLASKLGIFSCFGDLKPHLHAPLTINRNFIQRGYRQCALEGFCFLPPVKRKASIKRLNFLNVVGKMLWPFPSGFYCYIAQKYEPGYPTLPAEAVSQAKEYSSNWEPAINFDSKR